MSIAGVRSASSVGSRASGAPVSYPRPEGARAVGPADVPPLTVLYQELHPPLLRYLKAKEPRLGEDLASETWLRVADALPSFTGDACALRSWVFTIARCRLIDHRRRSNRRGDVIDLAALEKRPSVDDPETETLAAISADRALHTIRCLHPDQADAVFLRVVGGLETAEVALVMGRPEGTVRVLQHRGLRRLAKILRDEV